MATRARSVYSFLFMILMVLLIQIRNVSRSWIDWSCCSDDAMRKHAWSDSELMNINERGFWKRSCFCRPVGIPSERMITCDNRINPFVCVIITGSEIWVAYIARMCDNYVYRTLQWPGLCSRFTVCVCLCVGTITVGLIRWALGIPG